MIVCFVSLINDFITLIVGCIICIFTHYGNGNDQGIELFHIYAKENPLLIIYLLCI